MSENDRLDGDASENPKIPEDVSHLLTSGEQVLAVAEQIAVKSPLKRDRAVVTTRRIIIYRPKMFGRMTLQDFLWQDVSNVAVSTQVLGATFSVEGRQRLPDGSYTGVRAQLEGLDKKQACKLYAKAQEIEQQWREKNRIRQMEEERAKAGGVYLNPNGASAAGTSMGGGDSGGKPSVEERLAQLKKLNKDGLITDAEYESRKAQIISEL